MNPIRIHIIILFRYSVFSQERQRRRFSCLRGLLHQWQRALTLAARRQQRGKRAAERRHAELRRREKEEQPQGGAGQIGKWVYHGLSCTQSRGVDGDEMGW